jgi:deoxyribodipyrimidine photolyase-related protein
VSVLRLVLGDQLTRGVAALADLDAARDVVLMAEVMDEAVYVRHHKQKIAFIFSAMRHFAEQLRGEGMQVRYVKLDDPDNAGSLKGEVARAIAACGATGVVATMCGEWRLHRDMLAWEAALQVPVEIREDDRFFASRDRFAAWAHGRRELRMEFFYREMRRATGLLMDGDQPRGGRWNYDAENRKPLAGGLDLPDRLRAPADAITREVLDLVAHRFEDHFGSLADFDWAVTRDGALMALDDFIAHALPRFGDYQDAMAADVPFVFHAVISPYLNAGLLTPREVCQRAQQEFDAKRAPLNAVEGFIRQILGWREYVRGIYWLKMPDYADTNALAAKRPLPWFYWTGETEMRCLSQVIGMTHRHAYSHHIQRLMVTGNFALIAGIAPREVEEWYLIVYADAYEWVELPNTHGLSLYADGGLMASKPYASGGAYIDRMSDFCGGCAYDVKKKSGPRACPFNYLYWAFLIRNASRLRGNPRLAMPYRTIDRWDDVRQQGIVMEAEAFLDGLAYQA